MKGVFRPSYAFSVFLNIMPHRQIILDTETTGLTVQDGHRIIEIAAVELIDRSITGRQFHQYIHPQRSVDPGAFAVHGISEAFLADKPTFTQICHDLIAFIEEAELIIHNAPFDVSFLDNELRFAGIRNKTITDFCTVLDTLLLARKKHPGQQNSLDALCKRYCVDNSQRELHGALLDAHLLAAVYLAMTGGQTSLLGEMVFDDAKNKLKITMSSTNSINSQALKIIFADLKEITDHEQFLKTISKTAGVCLWEE